MLNIILRKATIISSFLIVCFFFIGALNALFSQTANITGKVTGAKNLEGIPGTTVTIIERNISTTSDNNGIYKINDVKPGKVTVEFSNVAYETRKFSIDITPGQVLVLDAPLNMKGEELEGVVVTNRRRTGSINSVISDIKNTKAVASGISKQQIAISQDNNAAEVMSRVSGVTVIGNRFVMVRGLSERYNNIMINDVIAPSTEVDKRTFSFDLIPSGSLDRMLLYKSATAENPGDFAGAVIKVYTNNDVPNNFTELSFGAGFRTNTTFQPYFQSKGSPTDMLGFDNGFRNLPSNFPTTNTMQSVPRSSPIRQSAGRILENNWDVRQTTAIPDFKVGFSMGRKFNIGKIQASNITVLDYAQRYVHYNRDFTRFFEYDPIRPQELDQRFAFLDDIYEKDNRFSLMSNFLFRLNNRSTIKFSNLFNQIGENETNLRQGEDFIQTLGWRRHYQFDYRSRSIYSGQFEGNHNLNPANKLKWVLGGSFLLENQPDLRRFRTFAPDGAGTPKDNFTMITPPSSNLFDASRYFGDLFEFSVNQGLDYTHIFGTSGKKNKELKLGYYVDYRYRDFESRYMSFLIPGNVGPDRKQFLENQPLATIFSAENISTQNGYVLEEGTRPQDSYEASNFLTAGYASAVIPVGNFVITAGARAEYNIQKLDAIQGLIPISVDNPVLSILPSVNVLYEHSPKAQFRLGYGSTVNRPEFRELAPFSFYDFKLDANKVGEPTLTNAQIHNIDLRYELYPRLGESISIGAFFKYFNDPIENRSIITTELPTFTYINADYAYNYGLELELRKSLDQVFNNVFLSKLSLNLNATYIYSIVDLGTQASAQQRERPLQGQSPYIVNSIIGYNDLKKKNSAALSYNVFGRRLFAVGDINNPDIWEMPRHSLDFTFTKSFNAFALKAGLQDILNYKYNFVQDSDRDGKVNNDIDRTVFSFRRGALLNFTFTFKL
jgi:hypothetical protein